MSETGATGLVPEWLSDLQARFGAALRTPLDRTSGTLRAQRALYDEPLCHEILPGSALSAAETLAIYNRQYYCRLFGVLQSEYPLTARLFGYWHFNEHAARFLQARAPRGADIHEAADGFDEQLCEALPRGLVQAGGARVPRAAILEAAAIDAAWRRAHQAPEERLFQPSVALAATLAERRLRPQSGWTLIEETWPLVELRRTIAGDPSESALPLPPRLPAPQRWAIFHAPGGAALLPLAPRQAQLFQLLTRHTVGGALARLEASVPPRERARLPADVRAWLAQSVELGFWVDIDEYPAASAASGQGDT